MGDQDRNRSLNYNEHYTMSDLIALIIVMMMNNIIAKRNVNSVLNVYKKYYKT